MVSRSNEEMMARLKDLQLKYNSKLFGNNSNEEIDLYKNRCSMLESDLKDKTATFSKELFKYKAQALERSTTDILKVKNSYEFSQKGNDFVNIAQSYQGISTVNLN